MPALKEEVEFGVQVDQDKDDDDDDEESGSEEEESEEDDDDDDEESGTTEDDNDDEEEETEEEETTEDEKTTDDDDDDDDDDEDDDDEEDEDEETSDDDDDADESDGDDDDDDGNDTFQDEDEEGLITGEAADRDVPGEDDNKKKVLGVCLIAVVVLALILGLAIGLGKRNKDDGTPAPTPAPTPTATPAPTPAPTIATPTMPPTVEEILEELTVLASASTTIYVDGQFQGDNFGDRDIILVQGGEAGNNDLPSAYSLVQFDLDSTELAKLPEPVEIEICLEHVVSSVADRTTTYSTCILPFSNSVNEYTGTNAIFQVPADCVNGKTATFEVRPGDTTVCIPATELVLGAAASNTTNEVIDVRHLRGWWFPEEDRYHRKLLTLFENLVLVLYQAESSDQPGDEFYSSNDSEGRVPLVEFVSLGDNMTDIPTMEPNATDVPEPQYEPCGMCGTNFTATILNATVPGSDGLSCAAVEQACNLGFCDPSQCAALPLAINDICGCTTTPASDGTIGI